MKELQRAVDSADNLENIILNLRKRLEEFKTNFPVATSVDKLNFIAPDKKTFLEQHQALINALNELNLQLNAKNSFAAKQFKKEVIQVLKELWDPAVDVDAKVNHINELKQKGQKFVGASATAVAIVAIAIVVGAVIGALVGFFLTGGLAVIPAAIVGAKISSALVASSLLGGYLGLTCGVMGGGVIGIGAGYRFFYKEPAAAIQAKEEQDALKNFIKPALYTANFKS